MNNKNSVLPLVVVFVADLYFSVRIENAAEGLNFRIRLVEDADQIAPFNPKISEKQLAEHLGGQSAVLLDKITQWHPALMIFDLNNQHIPWQDWIAVLKSVPATRRIPILAFGSHIDVETMKAAKNVGSDAVLGRSRFISELPKLIKKFARVPDYEAIADACQQPLSDSALKGLAEFNQGEYFEAHEFLEDAWNADETASKELYRAILQIAVAYLQIERGNYRGAVKMFLRARQWFEPLPEQCKGVDVAQLRTDANVVEEILLALGSDRIQEFDRSLFKPVRYSING